MNYSPLPCHACNAAKKKDAKQGCQDVALREVRWSNGYSWLHRLLALSMMQSKQKERKRVMLASHNSSLNELLIMVCFCFCKLSARAMVLSRSGANVHLRGAFLIRPCSGSAQPRRELMSKGDSAGQRRRGSTQVRASGPSLASFPGACRCRPSLSRDV